MSKLDDIVIGTGLDNIGMANTKQEIKELFIGMLGEIETYEGFGSAEGECYTKDGRNNLREELRNEIEQL